MSVITTADALAFVASLPRQETRYPEWIVRLHEDGRRTARYDHTLALAKGRYLGEVIQEMYPIEEEV